jgi:uncharacterized protein (TIGR00645 family)
MKKSNPNLLERIFETILWKSRLIVMLPVIFSLLGALILFYCGSLEIIHTASPILKSTHDINFNQLLIGIIGAVDLYLIAIVLLIFSFGIYELFVSKIDIAQDEYGHNILEIETLDELKNKLIKVVIMVLIVNFFKTVLSASFTSPLDILYLGLAILCVAGCTFFIRRIEKEE